MFSTEMTQNEDGWYGDKNDNNDGKVIQSSVEMYENVILTTEAK